MKIKISNYTFNAAAKTITFTDYASISLDQVLLITNVTDNIIIYNFADPTLGGTVGTNVLTLTYNTASMANGDKLQIFFEDNVGNTLGDQADTAASSDTGTFSIVALFKRALQNWTSLLARIPALLTVIPSDDTDSSAIPVRALPMHTTRIGYTKVISGGVDPDWGTTVILGTGMAVNQTGGNLVITSGTTARAETIIRSLEDWKGGVRMRNRITLSQRIANNNFWLELVDVIGDGLAYTINSATSITVTIPSNPFTAQNIGQSMYLGAFNGTGTFLSGRYAIASIAGNDVTYTVSGFAVGSGTLSVFGWNYYQLQYQGTTATSVNFDTQRNGWLSGATIATTTLTSASPGHMTVLTGNDLIATLSDQLVASSTTIAQTLRASRAEGVPDDIALRFQVRIANGSTAPASTTTFTVGLTAISNFANQDVVIQDVRPMGNANALPVEILRSVAQSTTVTSISAGSNAIGDVGLQYRSSSGPAGTPTILNSPATPAVQTIKGSAGRLFGIYVANSNAAARYLKIFNATTPTLGTTSAVLDIAIPPNSASVVFIKFEGGIPFTVAITAAVTGARGATDNTAITLNDVTGFTFHA